MLMAVVGENPCSEDHQHHHQAPSHGENPSNSPTSETLGVALKHNPGFSPHWSATEQSILEAGLANYASEVNVQLYAKIAMQLPKKTVRDVALRCKWMTSKEISRRKKEEHNSARKTRDRKDKLYDPSAKLSNLPSLLAKQHITAYTVDNDAALLYEAIGGPIGQLLQQNLQAFNQITKNLAAHQFRENISLFLQTRDNIFRILNNLADMSDVLKQMPPLPERVNEELANSVLARSTFRTQS